MKRILCLLLAVIFTCQMFMLVSASDKVEIYVAPNGSDSNDGTIDAPFATIEKAVEVARGASSAVVYLREGKHSLLKTINLTEKDSNLEIRSYPGEKAVVSSSYDIPASSFEPISDEAVKGRLSEKSAREKVLVSDLKELGITEYGSIKFYDLYYGNFYNETGDPAIYYNGEMLTLARYPNEDYINIDSVVVPGGSKTDVSSYRTGDPRVDKWKEAKDVWTHGFFKYDYADGVYPVTIDYDNGKLITTKEPTSSGVDADRRFYFFNLFEEIDVPGEYYIDRENGLLYMYPKDDMKNADISFSAFEGYMFKIENAENISFKNITFEECSGGCVNAVNSKSINIDSCEFTNLYYYAAWMENVTDVVISSNHVHKTGAGVFHIKGGDEKTLTHSGNIITNNHIEDYARLKTTYHPAINFQGVGNVVSHNKIHNAPHFAVCHAGQEHVFEYNEIYDVCKDSSDAGALYYGQEIHEKGNIIRYNYFHDMTHIESNQGMKIWGVYLDDGFSSAEVYGNVFDRVSGVALYGGGRNNTFENNLMINCEYPFTMDARRTWDGWSWLSDGQKWVWDRLNNLDLENGVWAEKYPELGKMRNDEPDYPKYNVIRNNISYNVPPMSIDPLVTQYGTVENNIDINDTKVFADFRNKDYTIKEDSVVYQKIPDWKPIPYEKIGLITEHEQIAEKSVILKIGSSKAVAMGKTVGVDSSNPNVKPQIIDGRTLVPVRFIAESFGCEVGWDDATKTVSINGSKKITLVLGSRDITVDGVTSELDVAAQSIEGRTMVPLRAIVEALGKTVFWDNKGLIVMSDEDIVNPDDEIVIDLLIGKVE